MVTRHLFRNNAKEKAYSEIGMAEGSFPISEAMHREVLSLPIGPHLSEADASLVIQTLRRFENSAI